jgi:hypothetical protein
MIRIKIVSDLDKKGLEEAQRGLDKLKGIADASFKVLAAGAGLAAIGIGKFANDSIRAASNLQESTNAVNVAFGKSAAAVLEVGANSAKSLGLARNEFNEAAVRFSAFAERIVGDGGDASTFIAEVTQRASDFASVFNIEVSEALRVFQSGLAGEAEPLKRFGINLLQSEVQAFAMANGIGEVGRQLTETEKVQARYGLLLESTAKTAGDFANTSDDLANSQRILKAQFTDLQAEIGGALLPAFTDLFKAVADQVMPELEKLGEFLNSPEGQKAISDFADTVADLTIKFIENIPQIINVVTNFAILVTAIKIATTAIQLATTATALFNGVLLINPFVALAVGIASATAALALFHEQQKRAREEATGLKGEQAQLNAEFGRLKELLDNGIITFDQYRASIDPLIVALSRLEGQFGATVGEFNRFNNLRPPDFSSQLGDTRVDGARLAANQRELFEAMQRTQAVTGGVVDTPTPTGGGGPSAFEVARKRVQELIQGSQKQLADAQKSYNTSVQNANKNYADSVLRLQTEFASRLENIIQSSQNRLRDAYRSAVETNIAGLFDQQEEKSVAGLVKSLSDKLTASRTLLSNSAQLASQGFSQTFIEQIVSAGTETGNELAKAILESTPETQSELRSLFTALEIESSQGMDSLAEQIYTSQGLATQELKNLYENTQTELAQAMLDQQSILESSLTDANNTFIESVQTIKSALAEQLADMEGQFGGMNKTIDQFMSKLDELIAKYGQLRAAQQMDFMTEPVGTSGPQISFQPMPTTPSNRPSGSTSPTININVKTDTTQSNAMVGKAIAKEVNKYTGGGGGLRGVKVIAL